MPKSEGRFGEIANDR